MSFQSHIDRLQAKRRMLEEQIHNAYTHHLPTMDLKKQRLRLEDEIATLTAQG